MNSEQKISALLKEMGIPCNLSGFHYIKEALMLIQDKPACGVQTVKGIYPAVAEKFNVTASCIERNIRHSVEKAFENMPVSVAEKIFGNTYSMTAGRPSNANFLFTVAEYLKYN